MTESKRSNAAGEKYALRGIYGSEPYWPQEKLKICVTGAGGFIGMRDFIFFLFLFFSPRGEAASSWRDRAGLARSFSLFSRVETRERENVLLFIFARVVTERVVVSRFLFFSLSRSSRVPSSSRRSCATFCRTRSKSAADSASLTTSRDFLKTTFR